MTVSETIDELKIKFTLQKNEIILELLNLGSDLKIIKIYRPSSPNPRSCRLMKGMSIAIPEMLTSTDPDSVQGEWKLVLNGEVVEVVKMSDLLKIFAQKQDKNNQPDRQSQKQHPLPAQSGLPNPRSKATKNKQNRTNTVRSDQSHNRKLPSSSDEQHSGDVAKPKSVDRQGEKACAEHRRGNRSTHARTPNEPAARFTDEPIVVLLKEISAIVRKFYPMLDEDQKYYDSASIRAVLNFDQMLRGKIREITQQSDDADTFRQSEKSLKRNVAYYLVDAIDSIERKNGSPRQELKRLKMCRTQILKKLGMEVVPIALNKTQADSRFHDIVQTKRSRAVNAVVEIIQNGLRFLDATNAVIRRPVVVRGGA